MKFKLFKKADRQILSTAGLLFLISLLLLWQDAWIYRLVQTNEIEQERIGEVIKSRNDVRRRYETALSWLPLKKNTDIFQGDSIFTGDNSTVVIKTVSGEAITVEPNSFIVIRQRKGTVNLNIGFGSVEGNIGKDKRLLISSNNRLTELNGNNGRVKVDAGEGHNLLLNVMSGEVRVRGQEGESLLRSKENALLTNEGLHNPTSPNITQLSPLSDQHLKIRDEAPVLFTWKSERKFNRMSIKIATDRELKNNLIDTSVEDNSFSAYSLPQDTQLYWQVMAEGGASPISQFALVGNRPPIPNSPKPGFQFFFDPKANSESAGSRVDLAWEPGSLATQFDVELATSPDMKRDLQTFKSRSKRVSVGFLQEGTYFWRARSSEFNNQTWSSVSSFRVGPAPSNTISAPIPTMASDLFLIPTRLNDLKPEVMAKLSPTDSQKYIEQKPKLHWAPVTHADEYLIEIAKSRNFKNSLVRTATTRSSFNWESIEPGTYYWRVKAEAYDKQDGLFSQPQTVNVGVAPPIAISKTIIVDDVNDPFLMKSAPPPIEIAWNPTVFTAFYEVEFGAHSNFEGAERFVTSGASKQVHIDHPGVYFWRIRSLDNAKAPISPFSQVYSFEFKRAYHDPTITETLIGLYPQEKDSLVIIGKEKSDVDFHWSNAYREKKPYYRLELSYDPKFHNVFFSDLTPDTHYNYKTPFTASAIYWRVRAESKSFTSEWTKSSRFTVSYESSPFDLATSDQIFMARRRAQERQAERIAEGNRKLAKLRSPAGSLQIQLDTPQIVNKVSEFKIESNLNLNLSPLQIAAQPFSNFYDQMREYPVIHWQKVIAAERYVIEIARDPRFEKVIVKSQSFEPFFTWDTARPGVFYYRVQAFNEHYAHSARSSIETLKIEVEAPTPTNPDQFTEMFDEPRDMWGAPRPFTLSWTPVVFARGYEVELAEDANFNNTKVFRTVANSREFTVSRSGMYFWRVRAMNELGAEIGPFSSVRSVEIIQTQRGPANVNGLSGLFPLNRTMVFVGQGVMNLAFQWLNPHTPDRKVKLEVSTTPNFAKLIASAVTNNQKALIKNDLPDGPVYWRVRSGKELSATYEFDLRRERGPYQPPPATTNLKTATRAPASGP